MTFPYLRQITFSEHTPIREVMTAFNQTAIHTMGRGVALLVDEQGRLIGLATDGDIRRGLASGCDIDSPISQVMNRQFIKATEQTSPHHLLRLFEKSIKNIPIIDDEGRPLDLINFSSFGASARNSFRLIRARAPVRISFCGGGTDMSYYFNQHDGRVLSATINKFAYCSIRVREDHKIRIISRDYSVVEEADDLASLHYGSKLDLIKACIKLMEPSFGFDLETYSEIDPGTGLGGSSAIAAAVVGVLNHFRNELYFDLYHLADLTYQAERVELQVAGGWQDQYAALFGGINLIEFRASDILVIPLRIPRDTVLELRYNLMLFRFGQSRESGEIITDQKSTYEKTVEAVSAHYKALSELTLKMQQSLLKGDLVAFGRKLHESWEIKRRFSLKISNPFIEKLYQTAINAGALGGKVLGAGGSGYLLVYCDPSHHERVIDALTDQGARLEPFDFINQGLEVWSV